MLSEGFELLEKYGIKITKHWVNEVPLHSNFAISNKGRLKS